MDLQQIADEHNRKGTRSAHRLTWELQAPLADRLRLILAQAVGQYTTYTLQAAIDAIEGQHGQLPPVQDQPAE